MAGRTHLARRRGTAYVLVLSVTMLIMVMAVAVGLQARVRARQAALVADAGGARTLAASGTEYAVFKVDEAVQAQIGGGPPWRDQFTHGQVIGPVTFANGSFTWRLEDATGDGDLSNDPLHPVDVFVDAAVGANAHRVKLQMEPGPAAGGTPPPLSSLGVTVQSIKKIVFTSCTVNADQIFSASNKVEASGASIYADIESTGQISGGNYYGSNSSYVSPPRQMPNASVFDYYINNGTAINYSSLVNHGGIWNWIWGDTLSPNSNPFGSTNPLGIYVIDCGGQDIGIAESRIVGTIVLINPGSNSVIEGPLNWEPAIANYPALLVKGQGLTPSNDITIRMSDTRLSELTTVWGSTWLTSYAARVPNFNPPGTPWRGNTDVDLLDDYVSAIAGLIYVEGELTIASGPYGNVTTLEGVALTEKLEVTSGATLNTYYKDVFNNDPPPGFASGSAPPNAAAPMQIIEGSWEQVVD